MQAVALLAGENLTRFDNRRNERIMRGVGAFGTSEMLFGWFTNIDRSVVGSQIWLFDDRKNGFITRKF